MFPNNDFDRNFAKRTADFDRNFKRAATGFGIWWVFSAVLSLAVLGVLAYVAFHFIMKVW